jgi:tRNA threonylcarbamoyladenosine biosynthesis protein TsaB
LALLLHIETSTEVCSVALSHNASVLALEEELEGYAHSEKLISFCNTVLKKNGLQFKDLEAVCVSKGPGSYTGLRIGVSAAKGICYALNLPLISVHTLQHMAWNVSQIISDHEAYFCPMIDARRMEVYCAFYDHHNQEVLSPAAEIIDKSSFDALLKMKKIYFFGNGSDKCKEILSIHPNALFVEGIVPSAQNMIQIAEQKFLRKEFENTAYFEPFYLKDFWKGSA